MESLNLKQETARPFLTWQVVIKWGKDHYRERTFRKDERIPSRPGLLYLVEKGAVRVVGETQESPLNKYNNQEITPNLAQEKEEAFLGFVVGGEPFEIVIKNPYNIEAYAHVEDTSIIWLYWQDLDNWPHFKGEIFNEFRRQHQRKLLWLSVLGQKHTIDRLFGFLSLLMEEYGQPQEKGYCLPYPLTHAQIASAIGSTRVTVTRLMGKLRQMGLIVIEEDGLICLPHLQPNSPS
jgi:CRP-like cAMP-binding protein